MNLNVNGHNHEVVEPAMPLLRVRPNELRITGPK